MSEEIRTFPRLTPINKNGFVGKELDRRKNRMFGSNANPRAVWVRAISNTIAISHGVDRQSTFKLKGQIDYDTNILVGGLLKRNGRMRGDFDSIYRRPGRSIQDRPIAGIDSIQVTSKGDLQSLREVTISWTCPSVEDLDILTPFWLSPGVSIFVEWGWSEPNKQLVKVDANNVSKLNQYYNDRLNIYNDIVKASNGNQEGYIGIIKNFSWNQNDDGSYSCTTVLSSMGQTFLSLDLNKDKTRQGGKGANESDEKNQSHRIKDFIKENFTEEKLLGLSNSDGVLYINTNDIVIVDRRRIFNVFGEKDVFVSWRFIEEAIINGHATLVKNDSQPAYKIDSSYTKISNDPLLYSTDIDTLLIVKRANLANPNKYLYFDSDPDVSFVSSAKMNVNTSKEGFLRSLYVNSELVKETFEESETLEEALNKLLRKMSEAAADIWDFKLQPKSMNENVLEVVDLNYTSVDDLNDIKSSMGRSMLSFGGYSGKSLLQSISFQSKITDQLALKYFVGRNAKNENLVVNDDNNAGISRMFRTYKDRILSDLIETESPIQTKRDEISDEEANDEDIKDFNVTIEEMRTVLQGRSTNKYNEIKSSELIILDDKGKEILVEYLNRPPTDDPSQVVRFTPLYKLEVEVTIDGISGLFPGYCFTLDNLPSMFRDTGVFQIIEVGHDINGDEWTTNLRAYFKIIKTEKD